MSRLPQLSGWEAVRAFERDGWDLVRQCGSHAVLTKPGSIVTLSVPLHDRLGRGLLHDLIRKAGLTPEEFLELL